MLAQHFLADSIFLRFANHGNLPPKKPLAAAASRRRWYLRCHPPSPSTQNATRLPLARIRDAVENAQEHKLLIFRPDRVVLAGIENEQRMRPYLNFSTVSAGKHAVALEHHNIKRRTRRTVLFDTLSRLECEAQHPAVVIDK